ncbi:MAG: substrate-binding domain-containing protein [Oscillospiraceae bacterium]
MVKRAGQEPQGHGSGLPCPPKRHRDPRRSAQRRTSPSSASTPAFRRHHRAVKATACTNNENAAAIAADKFNENETVVEAMKNATSDNPVIIGCLSQDAVSASVTGRTTGFVDEMAKIAETYQPGKVSIEGHAKWEKKVDAPAIIIEVAISATTEATAVQTAANSLLGMNPVAIFCSNEGAVTGFLAAVSDGEDLAEGGKYAGLVVAGFDAGAAQKNAVRQGWFYGSVTQDPYQIAMQAAAGCQGCQREVVEDVDTGAQWYDASNIDDDDRHAGLRLIETEAIIPKQTCCLRADDFIRFRNIL